MLTQRIRYFIYYYILTTKYYTLTSETMFDFNKHLFGNAEMLVICIVLLFISKQRMKNEGLSYLFLILNKHNIYFI